MSEIDYAKFVVHYREMRLGTMDFAFVLLWRKKLDGFDPLDLIGAVDEVAADPRAGFPLNDESLLIEHANALRQLRERKPIAAYSYGDKEKTIPRWDQKLCELGVITPAEVKRRQRERQAG